MVIDTSALLAILHGEAERDRFLALIETAPIRMIFAPNAVEASIVVLSRRHEAGLAILRTLLGELRTDTAPLNADHVALAVEAFRRFGRGRHRAGLNLGDCFAYALAKATGEPLLYKGDDFGHTDALRAA